MEKTIPRRLKPQQIYCGYGTADAVPFQSFEFFRSLFSRAAKRTKRPGFSPRGRSFPIGGNTFQDGSGQWQLRLISASKNSSLAVSEPSVAICYREFAKKEKRERLNGEVCALLYRITVGKRKL